MIKADITELRSKIDLERKYVDFATVRNILTVWRVANDTGTELTEPNMETGECRASCPKCEKPRSFALNINTNRFNCFNKGCDLRGGGVIDFFARLFDVPAKEACHLLACAYGIQPYSADLSGDGENGFVFKKEAQPIAESADLPKAVEIQTKQEKVQEQEREVIPDKFVLRSDYDELAKRVERLSNIVFGFMLEHDENCHQNFEDEVYEHLVSH